MVHLLDQKVQLADFICYCCTTREEFLNVLDIFVLLSTVDCQLYGYVVLVPPHIAPVTHRQLSEKLSQPFRPCLLDHLNFVKSFAYVVRSLIFPFLKI